MTTFYAKLAEMISLIFGLLLFCGVLAVAADPELQISLKELINAVGSTLRFALT